MNRRKFLNLLAGAAAATYVGVQSLEQLLPAKKPWTPEDIGWFPEQYIGEIRWVSFPTGWWYKRAPRVEYPGSGYYSSVHKVP